MNGEPIMKAKREIRSYVLRSRMTSLQITSLEQYWSLYGVDLDNQMLNFSSLFNRDASVIIEIGFGMGSSLITMAKMYPEINFLGIEVHKPGIGALLAKIVENKLSNVRVIADNAVKVLQQAIPDNSLLGVLVFFPDPWPKRRHHKRRLVQAEFVQAVENKLQPGGYLHLATDVIGYANHMAAIVSSQANLTIINKNKSGDLLTRPKTKFEQRGERLEHSITDLCFLKC